MDPFILNNPTVLHFGKDVINDLGKTIQPFGKKVLLVYGKNSIKENGIYRKVIDQLKSINAEVFEYSGIKSNPVITDVDAAAELGRKNNVEVILAVGGGSVIDSAKIISIAIPVQNPAWEFFEYKIKPQKSIPLITILTLAATGTEMNSFAVVQNEQTKEKPGYGHRLLYPRHSFLDPQNTFSVSKEYTAYGIADLIAHSLEAYFGKGDASLSDKFSIAIIKEAIEFGPALLDDLKNYELRSKIMYAATMALNGLTLTGKPSGDWGVHSIGHCFSVLYDTPHGASLTIAYPAWFRLMKNRISDQIQHLGKELFNVNYVDETINKFEQFFQQIGCPVKLADIGIAQNKFPEIIEVMKINKVDGMNFKFEEGDYEKLLELMA